MIPLHLLLVEDSFADAELIHRQLEQAGFTLSGATVATEPEFLAALDRSPDIVICDWTLPSFSGPRALELLRESGREIPLLLVSGTLGEDTAVSAMRQGASDYLLKDRLARLPAAVEQAITQSRLRRDQRAAAAALAAAEARYRGIVENADDGMFQLAADGRFLTVNAALARLAGYDSPAAMLAAAPSLDAGWFADAAQAQAWTQRLAGEGKIQNFEAEIRRRDGSTLWTSLSAHAVHGGPDGAISHFEGTIADITQRRQYEAKIRQAQKLDAVGTLAGGIAHDFNNLLSAIIGNGELALMRTRDNPAVAPHLEALLQGAFRAGSLVRQILAFSRRQEQPRTVLQLRHVVNEPFNLMRSTLPATVELANSSEHDLPPVLADAGQIHQVVMNLCTNAWQAMPNGRGRIELRLSQRDVDQPTADRIEDLHTGPYVVMEISDNGVGMDAATQRRIFEPFFTTREVGKGSGLGLAAVHGIVKNHQGAIEVESRPGVGSVFRVYFPAQRSAADEFVAPPPAMPRGKGECVLLVDDEPALVKLGRAILEELGYFVVAAPNVDLAISIVQADPEKINAVITDLTMPQRSGIALARELQQIRAGLPVILVTGNSDGLEPDVLIAAGIREVLTKPLTVHALATALFRILAQK